VKHKEAALLAVRCSMFERVSGPVEVSIDATVGGELRHVGARPVVLIASSGRSGFHSEG